MATILGGIMDEFNEREESNKPKEQAKGLKKDKYILAQKHDVNQAEYVYDGDGFIVNNIVHYENLST